MLLMSIIIININTMGWPDDTVLQIWMFSDIDDDTMILWLLLILYYNDDYYWYWLLLFYLFNIIL